MKSAVCLLVLAIGCGKSAETPPEAKPSTPPTDPASAVAASPAATTPPTASPDPASAAVPASPPTTPAAPEPASATSSPAPGTAPPPCTAEAVRTARREAGDLVKRKDYSAADARLARLLASCELETGETDKPNIDFFWVHSDRAFIAYKSKDYVECLRVLAPLTTPKPPLGLFLFDLEDSKVGKAILHNEELCTQGHAEARKEFQKSPCQLGESGQASVGLPAEALPPGAQAGCLVLQEGAGGEARDRALESGDVDKAELCGALVLRTRKASGAAPTETALKVDDGPLVDSSSCCALSELSVSIKAGTRRVRVQGLGRDCFGGTAEEEYDAIYGWKGDSLTFEENDGRNIH